MNVLKARLKLSNDSIAFVLKCRKRTQKSPNTLVITSAEHQSPSSKENDRYLSPTGKRESPVTVRGSESQYPKKPPRLSPSPTPSISPLLKRRKEEKVVIPTILVEDETKTDCDAGQMRTNEMKSGAAEGKYLLCNHCFDLRLINELIYLFILCLRWNIIFKYQGICG